MHVERSIIKFNLSYRKPNPPTVTKRKKSEAISKVIKRENLGTVQAHALN